MTRRMASIRTGRIPGNRRYPGPLSECSGRSGRLPEGDPAPDGRAPVYGDRKYHDGCGKAGGDRQELHERIRELSMEAGKNVKEKGLDNNLLELIAADPSFNLSLDELKKAMDPTRYTGRAKEQVDTFLANVVRPVLEQHKEELGVKAEIHV